MRGLLSPNGSGPHACVGLGLDRHSLPGDCTTLFNWRDTSQQQGVGCLKALGLPDLSFFYLQLALLCFSHFECFHRV